MDPLTPIDSQLAKGGNKGKPGVKPQLMEYWIIPNSPDGSLIHVAGTGDVDSVNANVVFDYFFNGVTDDNAPFDDHYEYQYFPPLPFPVEQTENGWHADIPLNGDRELNLPPYYTESWYHDALVTDVDGTGSDPFAFWLRFVKGPNVVGGLQPEGVYVEGAASGPGPVPVNSVFSTHGPQNVTSYAVYQGQPYTGTVTIASISIVSPTCQLTEHREGKGKNAVWVQTRTVTADYTIELIFDPPPPPIPPDSSAEYSWVEFHFLDGQVLSHRWTDRAWQPDGVMSGTVSLDLPDGNQEFDLTFAVDYVYPAGPLMDYAYDPASNSNDGFATTVGFGGAPWTADVTQTADDVGQGHFPVATTSPPVSVSCAQ